MESIRLGYGVTADFVSQRFFPYVRWLVDMRENQKIIYDTIPNVTFGNRVSRRLCPEPTGDLSHVVARLFSLPQKGECSEQ